jgi:hypothetical protein
LIEFFLLINDLGIDLRKFVDFELKRVVTRSELWVIKTRLLSQTPGKIVREIITKMQKKIDM